MIDRLLGGRTVVIASGGGGGRAGLVAACLMRDLGDYSADATMEFVGVTRTAVEFSAAQQGFIRKWEWPRRASVARALKERDDAREAEDRERYATLSAEEAALEKLVLALRQALGTQEVEAVHLASSRENGLTRLTCYLTGSRHPRRLAALVRSIADRQFRPGEVRIHVGPPDEAEAVIYRVLPYRPLMLGE